MNFDPSGLEQAFKRMQDTAVGKGKTMAQEQAGYFVRELKKQGNIIAPTAEKLKNIAQEIGWKLKRKAGVSPAKELQRRIRARRTFARGWRITDVTSKNFSIRIWFENKSAQSGKVDDKKQISEKAGNTIKGRFKSRLDKLANQITNVF